jgi:hypothetical protein
MVHNQKIEIYLFLHAAFMIDFYYLIINHIQIFN